MGKIHSSVNITVTYIVGGDYRHKIHDRAYMSSSKFENFLLEFRMEAMSQAGKLPAGEIVEVIPG